MGALFNWLLAPLGLLLGVLIAILLYRISWRPAMSLANRVGRWSRPAVSLIQALLLAVLILVCAVGSVMTLPTAIKQTPATLTALFAESPRKRTERYYAEISKGIEHMQFWRAYDLWSSCQRQRRPYEDFLVSHAQTERIELVRTETLKQTADRASVLAVVNLVRAVNGRSITTNHWVYYRLVKEDNQWRMDAFRQIQEIPQNDLNLPDDYKVCPKL